MTEAVTIKKIKNFNESSWDDFVNSSNNGTCFHKLKFLDYHEKNRFEFHNLKFFYKNKMVSVLPGCIKEDVFYSPAGASYGSFVFNDESFEKQEKVVDTFLDYCLKSKFKGISLTLPPNFYMKNSNEITEYILQLKGFVNSKSLITNALYLPNFKKDLIKSSFFRGVKKSFKFNQEIVFNDNFDEFYPMLLENKRKFNTTPTHTLEELKKLKLILGEDIKLISSYYEGNLLGTIMFIVTNNKTILAFYISHYYSHQEKRTVNRLFYELALWGQKKGFSYLDFGVSPDTFSDNPMSPSRSLINFKEGIGSRGFLRKTFTLELT